MSFRRSVYFYVPPLTYFLPSVFVESVWNELPSYPVRSPPLSFSPSSLADLYTS